MPFHSYAQREDRHKAGKGTRSVNRWSLLGVCSHAAAEPLLYETGISALIQCTHAHVRCCLSFLSLSVLQFCLNSLFLPSASIITCVADVCTALSSLNSI